MSQKVTLNAEDLYVLRSTVTHVDGAIDVRYYETVAAWNSAPVKATLFTDFDIGVAHMHMVSRELGHVTRADGGKEVFDVVPLYGEILNSPNGHTVHINRR